jgi:hypothetical protein
MTETLLHPPLPRAKSSTEKYKVGKLLLGDCLESKWDKNAVCTITKIRTSGKKPISIRWDNGRVVHWNKEFFEDMTRCSPNSTACSGVGAGFALGGLITGEFQLVGVAETVEPPSEIVSTPESLPLPEKG